MNATILATITLPRDKTISKARNHAYPYYSSYILLTIIGLLAVVHWSTLAWSAFQPNKRTRQKKKSYQLAATTVHLFRTIAFRIRIPIVCFGFSINVAEFLAACAYIVVIFTWEFVNTTNLSGERFVLRYWANRAGFIATTQLTFLVALGMKNNIISFLTGIGGKESILEDLHTAWLRWGLVASIAFSLLAILSIKPLRKRGYEIFLVGHFAAALIILVGAYIHIENFSEERYIYPAFALYFFDRLLRYLRLFYASGGHRRVLRMLPLPTRMVPSKAASATVELLSPSLLRMRVSGVPRLVRWSPGQVMYISAPTVSGWKGWQAHPFSIANIDYEPQQAEFEGESEHSTQEGISKEMSLREDSPVDSNTSADVEARKPKELVFLIRVRRGFTQSLCDYASESANRELAVFLDGPYGAAAAVEGYRRVLLFAGGSGVSYTLPLLLDILRSSSASCERVIFIWSVRDTDEIAAIADTVRAALARPRSHSLEAEIRIHVTKGKDVEAGVGERGRFSDCVQVFAGRADIAAIIREEVGGCASSGKNMSVNVCGPNVLSDEVRNALWYETSAFEVMNGEKPLVALHVEAFGL
ncbi:FAD-binding FR-type domain-containing protein [Mycena kentingensis (nom. inval.)]|nr:FAD-binding FR-type domain-containing protein [Mycena kentingensis (nom. inval.)]